VHIPDGFLSTGVAVATGGLAAGGLGVALRRARSHLARRRVPVLGLAAAFVFAAQMVNFPVAGGTSGHLVGAVLVAVLLGPSGAVIVMSAVLIVQCLMFADGGVTALGANILNMGVIGAVGGYGIVVVVTRAVKGLFGLVVAAGFAAWCSTVVAAVACAGELAASRTVAWHVALPAMAGVHMLIGVGEGLITALVVAGIGRVRPELLAGDAANRAERSYGAVVAYGILVALGLTLFVSPLASHLPDGLDRTAEVLGFSGRAVAPIVPAPMPDYGIAFLRWGALGTSIAGALGAIVAFVSAWLLARALVPASPDGSTSPAEKSVP